MICVWIHRRIEHAHRMDDVRIPNNCAFALDVDRGNRNLRDILHVHAKLPRRSILRQLF